MSSKLWGGGGCGKVCILNFINDGNCSEIKRSFVMERTVRTKQKNYYKGSKY